MPRLQRVDYRVAVAGPGGSGKSSITLRFISDQFLERYDPTIEDSYRRQWEVDGAAVVLDIMDTAGQEEYHGLRDQMLSTAEGFLIVFSLTSARSFRSVPNFIAAAERSTLHTGRPIILLGNKADRPRRAIKREQAEQLAERMGGLTFIKTSAKLDMGIDRAFREIVRAIQQWRADRPFAERSKHLERCRLL